MTSTTEALLFAPTKELPVYIPESPATITAELPRMRQELPARLGSAVQPAEIDPSFMPNTARLLKGIAEPAEEKFAGWDATSAEMTNLWREDEAADRTTAERPEIFEALLDNQAAMTRQRTLNRVRAELGVHSGMTHQEYSDTHHTVSREAYDQARAERPRWQRVLGVGRKADRREARAVVTAVMGTRTMEEGPLAGMGDVTVLPHSSTVGSKLSIGLAEMKANVQEKLSAAVAPVAMPLAKLRNQIHTRLYRAVRQPYTDVIYTTALAYHNLYDERSKARWVATAAGFVGVMALSAMAAREMLPDEGLFYDAAANAITQDY